MKLTTCPNCASRKIKAFTGAMTFPTPQGVVTIPNVTREKCANCGEEFFDHAANAVLDQYRSSSKNLYRIKPARDKRPALRQ